MGDFDGDGTLDCVKPAPTAHDVSFFKGLGAGVYAGTPVVTAGILRYDLYTVLGSPLDMDADGRDDIPIWNRSNSELHLLRGQADGTFAEPIGNDVVSGALLLPNSIRATVAAGDFNGDGKTDLLMSGLTSYANGENHFGWLVFHADTKPVQIAVTSMFGIGAAGDVQTPIAVGDLNGDGKLDAIATVLNRTLSGSTNRLAVVIGLGNGDFSFQAATYDQSVVPGTDGATSVVTADVNQDGKLDLVVGLPGGLTSFYGDGTAHFSLIPP